MKRIKYLGVLLSIVTLCVACEKSEKDGLGGFHKNFVELYVDGQIMLTEFQNECSGDAHRLSKKQIAGFVICIPSPKMYFFYGPDIEKFNRWAARNNDIDFNQVLANGALPMVATFADNFSKMVVTSNADWDEAHPAGTSLDCRRRRGLHHVPPSENRCRCFLSHPQRHGPPARPSSCHAGCQWRQFQY